MNEKEHLAKLEQQINDKSFETPNLTSDNDLQSNQTVDILQELLNTIKQNNQLEVNDLFVCLSFRYVKFVFFSSDKNRSYQTKYRK